MSESQPENRSEIPADYPILLETPIEPQDQPQPADPEEIENGCQWCTAEECLHHHTYQLPKTS